VTPTPHKKPKTSPKTTATAESSNGGGSSSKKGQPGYNRKRNSLGVLAETFVAQLALNTTTATATDTPPSSSSSSGGAKPPVGLTGQELIVDTLAADLQVERRRIYDVVNILEALQLVVKRGKNTYHWMGKEHLDRQFALLQNEAMEQWPEAASQHGLMTTSNQTPSAASSSSAANDNDQSAANGSSNNTGGAFDDSSKSLTQLSQLFVQVFLVGHDRVNLPQASDLIQGYTSTPEKLAQLICKRTGQPMPTDPVALQAAAARGLKTKIRRLYDIANVFLAVGLLVRCDFERRRPHYQWNYTLSAAEIRDQVWPTLSATQKRDQVPFGEEQTAAMEKIGLNPKQYVFSNKNNSNNSSQQWSSTTTTTKTLLGKTLLGKPPKQDKSAAVPPPPAFGESLGARRVSLPSAEQPRFAQV